MSTAREDLAETLEEIRESYIKALTRLIQELGRSDLKPENQREVVRADLALDRHRAEPEEAK